MDKHIAKSNKGIDQWQVILFCLYIFLSFFETYLTGFFGNITKYYLLMVIAIFLWQGNFKITINKYWIWFLIWFLYKVLSVSWSNMSNNDFHTHILSHIGVVLFVIVVTGRNQEKNFLYAIIQSCLWISFLFGILSIVFKGAFLNETFADRQVLTIFGLQNDPNNSAAFILVGIVIGLYGAIIEKKKVFLDAIIVAVNTYALLLTSSRAGLLSMVIIIVCIILLPQLGNRASLKRTVQKIIIIVLLMATIVFIIQRYLPKVNLDRLLVFSGYIGGSGRDIRWEQGMRLFYEKPIFGWGWGGYDTGTGAIHNTFLTSLCDVGIVGTLFLIIPIVSVVLESLRKKNVMALVVLMAGVVPSFVLDSINKRFFWNAIVISIMLITYQRNNNDEQIGVWGF